MRKLLMMGSTQASEDFVLLAKSQGVYVITADYLPPERSHAKLISDEHWLISTNEIDILEQKCRESGVDAVMCGISEFNQDQVLLLTKRLGLPCYCKPEAWHYNRNKADFKQKCMEYGVPVATNYIVSEVPTDEELDKITLPVIVKPTDRFYNLGISYCYQREEIPAAVEKALETSKDTRVVVEKMLKGKEHMAFFAVVNGDIHFLNFLSCFNEPGRPANCYTYNTTLATPGLLERYMKDVNPHIIDFLKGIGCTDGFVWVQLMEDTDDHTLKALEMGYRLSGELIWQAMKYVTGFDSLEWMLHYALHGYNDPAKLPAMTGDKLDGCAVSYILWTGKGGIVKRYEGVEELRQHKNMTVNIITNPGEQIWENCYGVIITFAAKDAADAIEITKYINDTIRMYNEDEEEMLVRYTQFQELEGLAN